MHAYVLLHFYISSGEQIVLLHCLTTPKLKTSLVTVYKKAPKNGLVKLSNVVINTAGIKTANKIYVSEVRIYNNN